jgi:type IV pilus assembly protein PilA
MRKRAAGFTWIELMMVMVVIGILALMTIPGMQDNVIKKQVKDALSIADLAKAGVQASWSASGDMPKNNADAGIPPKEKIISPMVTQVSVDDGAVTLTFGNNAHKLIAGKRLTIRPAVVPGEKAVPIGWLCHFAPVPQGMKVEGQDVTNIPQNHLPAECRGPEGKK